MFESIRYGWRWFATAFSFLLFGVGGILIPVLVIPVLYILPGGKARREQRGQKFIHGAFRLYIELMRVMGVLTYDVSGIEKLKDARLILANHPSLLDIVLLISFVPNANCVVKGKLLHNPVMRGALKTAGYIINDEAAENVIDAAAEAINSGHALIIFPEGTRTTPSEPIQLKRGAANIAIRTATDYTPVLIECIPTTLTKTDRWYQIPDTKAHFRIQVKDQIAVEPYLNDTGSAKAARALTADLSNFFRQELGTHE
ncbi:MAG: 1-acyl-sn-glycerol-3-phosphate acyltransferase [Pseudomonadales bacterium]|nr:1-acyl-sn-glycerol-3-phosphate acyltransferase [Pseudomonadales bacterium]